MNHETTAHQMMLDHDADEKKTVVYLTEGGHPDGDSPYAPSGVFQGRG